MNKLAPRKSVYRGIQMRSRLEAEYAAWMDRTGFSWSYEPTRYVSATGASYLPDFKAIVRDGDRTRPAFVECKPWLDGMDRVNGGLLISAPMHVIFESEPDAALVVAFGHWRMDHYVFDHLMACTAADCPMCEARLMAGGGL